MKVTKSFKNPEIFYLEFDTSRLWQNKISSLCHFGNEADTIISYTALLGNVPW